MTEFKHSHAAHCESGTVSSLLRYGGFDISEAMCFGISSALTFGYFPFIKINNQPLITYRMPPRHILKGVAKNLGAKFEIKTFKNDRLGAVRALDEELEKGRIVGVQTSVFYLPYFPKDMRFHFNAHNLIIFKKEGGTYFVSDPVFDYINTINEEDLTRARFAKGVLAPNGSFYKLVSPPKNVNFEKAIKQAVSKTVFMMLKTPLPIIGVWGMKTLAKKIASLKTATEGDKHFAKMFITQVIRMQEEIGTGGGGFRFMYASFLQESSKLLNSSLLAEASNIMSEAGDKLRFFALKGAKIVKNQDEFNPEYLSRLFKECALLENSAYKLLRKLK
ncbi:MAG: BtrH N-terminal domain-containing protein [Campylobacteraceae bacterium]|jgi:hypothetical protein|nr:BtrH N-terminal domain-containing protein [Campylobacteraceae bacterium]